MFVHNFGCSRKTVPSNEKNCGNKRFAQNFLLFNQLFDFLGCTLLYTDTDSLIYVCKNNVKNPLVTGNKLGELTAEYPTKRLTGFWRGGPKQYLLEYEDKETKEFGYVMKLRGMTLNEDAENSVSRENFKKVVENLGLVDEDKNGIPCNVQRIGPDDYGNIFTR